MEYRMITSYAEWESYFDEFAELYKLCFRQPMDKDEIRWRYFDSPYDDVVACFALDEGKLVANYSVSPVFLYRNGKVIKAAQSLNTMTHPSYTGRGLFVDLASKVYSFLKSSGYKAVWGFPNYISNRTFITKLNWKDLSVIPTLEVDLTKMQNIRYSDMVCNDDEIKFNYNACLDNSDSIQVYKSNEYLKWRYSNHPHNKYKIFAYAMDHNNATSRIVCKEYKDILNIVDYSFKNSCELEVLLLHAFAYAKDLGKTSLTIWAKLGDDMHLMLEKFGAKNTVPITYFGCVCFDDNFKHEFENCENWMMHMSDDNVY